MLIMGTAMSASLMCAFTNSDAIGAKIARTAMIALIHNVFERIAGLVSILIPYLGILVVIK